MDKQSADKLQVVVVLVGYYNPQIKKMAPCGFVMSTPRSAAIYYRADVADHSLPKFFSFTLRNLPAVIQKSLKTHSVAPHKIHKFLADNVFDGLGSFRCWQPMTIEATADEVDAVSYAVCELVNRELTAYQAALHEFKDSCSPRWQRLPEPEKLEVPALVCAQ